MTVPTSALNMTESIVYDESSQGADMVDSKEAVPTLDGINLGNSIELHETASSSSGSVDIESSSLKDRRRTYHVRHNTVSLPAAETLIAKEVADVLNELADTPPSNLMTALQLRLSAFALEKENQWKADYERVNVVHILNHCLNHCPFSPCRRPKLYMK